MMSWTYVSARVHPSAPYAGPLQLHASVAMMLLPGHCSWICRTLSKESPLYQWICGAERQGRREESLNESRRSVNAYGW